MAWGWVGLDGSMRMGCNFQFLISENFSGGGVRGWSGLGVGDIVH